ncbi:MAG: hypothetical protein R2830_19995 [Saprospiraceae bacterium]
MLHSKLILIKLLHTAIWAVMTAAIFHILYAGISGNISTLTFVAIGLITLEVITLFMNKMVCPLTPIARRYSDSDSANFDIYLPEWLARYNKAIFGTLLAVGTALVVWRLVGNW